MKKMFKKLMIVALAAMMLCAIPAAKARVEANAQNDPAVPDIYDIAVLYPSIMDNYWSDWFDVYLYEAENYTGLDHNLHYAFNIDVYNVYAAAEHYIQQGVPMIVGVSAGYAHAFELLAINYPDTYFLCALATTSDLPNLAGFNINFFESWFLAGYSAAAHSVSGYVGFVQDYYSDAISYANANAFALGAQYYSSSTQVYVANAQSGTITAANDLMAYGCDVIAADTFDQSLQQYMRQFPGILYSGYGLMLTPQTVSYFETGYNLDLVFAEYINQAYQYQVIEDRFFGSAENIITYKYDPLVMDPAVAIDVNTIYNDLQQYSFIFENDFMTTDGRWIPQGTCDEYYLRYDIDWLIDFINVI